MREWLLILLALTGPAAAIEIPRVDVDRSCRNAIRSVSSDEARAPEVQYRECFDAAQASYDRLKTIWPKLENGDQEFCVIIESSVKLEHHSAYRKLYGCAKDAIARAEVLAVKEQTPKREMRW